MCCLAQRMILKRSERAQLAGRSGPSVRAVTLFSEQTKQSVSNDASWTSKRTIQSETLQCSCRKIVELLSALIYVIWRTSSSRHLAGSLRSTFSWMLRIRVKKQQLFYGPYLRLLRNAVFCEL